MKKLLLLVSSIALLAGCDMGMNKNLTCENSATSAQGVTINSKYDIEYNGDKVKAAKITFEYVDENNTNTTDEENDTDVDNNDSTLTTDNDEMDMEDDSDDETAREDNKDEDNGEIVDGIVGDAIDDIIAGITDATLDLAGLRNRHEELRQKYSDVEGLSSTVDYDEDGHYTITYVIDFDKISDEDLAMFNIDRDINVTKDTYESQGLTCNES